eukprot:3870767-Amphidinium_carterae.1
MAFEKISAALAVAPPSRLMWWACHSSMSGLYGTVLPLDPDLHPSVERIEPSGFQWKWLNNTCEAVLQCAYGISRSVTSRCGIPSRRMFCRRDFIAAVVTME